MHGKIFKYSIDNQKMYVPFWQKANPLLTLTLTIDYSTVYISFGGLLMSLTGSQSDLRKLEIDSRIYLLLKKI